MEKRSNASGNGSGKGGLGGIWGGALTASLRNDIYAVTGNGPFNPVVGDWGNTYLKLAPSGKTLKVLDYFSPSFLFHNDDLDLGTNTGIILVVPGPFPHELIGGSKIGTLYVVNRDNMGKFNSTSDQIIQELPGAVGVRLSTSATCGTGTDTNECDYSSPAYWNGHSTAVITYQYNVQRTGANTYETTLTPANVNQSLFGKIFSCGVDSYIYGQPLFMPKLGISGSMHQFCSMMKSTVPGARLL